MTKADTVGFFLEDHARDATILIGIPSPKCSSRSD